MRERSCRYVTEIEEARTRSAGSLQQSGGAGDSHQASRCRTVAQIPEGGLPADRGREFDLAPSCKIGQVGPDELMSDGPSPAQSRFDSVSSLR